jgi:hypothetical protein
MAQDGRSGVGTMGYDLAGHPYSDRIGEIGVDCLLPTVCPAQ